MKVDARVKVIISIVASLALIALVLLLATVLDPSGLNTAIESKSLAPCGAFPFGTDWLGRDMLIRTVRALRFSLGVGLLGAGTGVAIAIVMGLLSALAGPKVDKAIMWLVDMFISMPHLIFMILISFVVGRGAKGVIIATAITHWPSLTRLIRNEVFGLKGKEYILLSRKMGKSNSFIIKRHFLPQIAPQIFIGFILLFPHVIIHEASMTFLGFGLSAQQPSIGIILSEAAKHISRGDWWLVILPGLALILIIKSFDNVGESLRVLLDPQARYR